MEEKNRGSFRLSLFMEGFILLSTRIIRENGTDFYPYSSIFTASSPRGLFY
jgi:hypothetical protein